MYDSIINMGYITSPYILVQYYVTGICQNNVCHKHVSHCNKVANCSFLG